MLFRSVLLLTWFYDFSMVLFYALQIEALEKMNEDHVQNHGKKLSTFSSDGDPPIYDE